MWFQWEELAVHRSSQGNNNTKSRRHTAKVVSAVVALFVVAVCVSSALADVGPLSSIITTSDTATSPAPASADATSDGSATESTSSDATATDGTSASSFLTDTTSTAVTTTSSSTTDSSESSTTGTPGMTSLIVKLVPGLSTEEQNALIARDGGTETRTIAPLRLHVV